MSSNKWLEEWIPFEQWKTLMASEHAHDRAHAADKPPPEPRDEVVRILARALSDEDGLVRQCAVEGLGHFRTAASRDAILQLLETESDEQVLSTAIVSAGMVGEMSTVVTLATTIATGRPMLALDARAGVAVASARLAAEGCLKQMAVQDWGTRVRAANLLFNYVYEILRSFDAVAEEV